MRQIPTTQSRAARRSRFTNRGAALALALAALTLTTAGCGREGTGPSGPGTGTMTATGAVSASGSGISLFQSESGLFQILVASTAGTWQLQIVNYSGRPAPGTYALAPLDPASSGPTGILYYVTGGAMTAYESTSGQLVITSSSTSAMRGSYTFAGKDVEGTATVTVQGSFDAQCAAGTTCQ